MAGKHGHASGENGHRETYSRGDGTASGIEQRIAAAMESVGRTTTRVELSLPAWLRRSLVRRFLLGAFVFAIVVPALALMLLGSTAAVGFVVVAGLLLGTAGFCERYYVLVGTEQRLRDLATDAKTPKPGTCIRDDEVGDVLDAVEETVDDYQRRVRAARTGRTRQNCDHSRNEALERRGWAWASAATETVAAVADGDFERRLDADDAPAGLTDLSTEFDRMLDELEGTLFNVESFADETERAGREAVDVGGDVTARTERLADRTDTVADRLERQQRDVERAAGTADDIESELTALEPTVTTAEANLEDAIDAVADVDGAVDRAGNGIEDAATTTGRARDDLHDVTDRVDDLEGHLDDFETLAARVGHLALVTVLHATRADRRRVQGADRFRTLAGEALVLADAADERVSACRTLLESVRDGTDAVDRTLAETDTRLAAAHEWVDHVADHSETLQTRVDAALDGVRDGSRDIERLTKPASHLTGVTSRVVERNERTTDIADGLAAETDDLLDDAAALDDVLGTVRTQAGFLTVQVENVATRDVGTVRTRTFESATTDS